jgi:hypothetical protein
MISNDEYETICLLIEEGWPGDFNDTAAAAWRVFLDDYEPAQVLVALKALVAKGGTFRPSVAEVVAQIRQDPSRPTPEEAYTMIYGPRGVMRARAKANQSYANEAAMIGAHDDAKVQRAFELHPLLGAFVERYGIRRLALLEVDSPEYGEIKRRELREAWERHCEAFEGREVAAIARGRRPDGLGRLDPFGALGIERKPALESGEAV